MHIFFAIISRFEIVEDVINMLKRVKDVKRK